MIHSSGDAPNFLSWIMLEAQDREDPYAMDILECGVRVADCHETHTDLEDYLRYWFQIAQMNALLQLL